MQRQPLLGRLERVENLSDRVYRVIRSAIVDRTLAPGSPINEPVVARQLGVSRTPVREALMKLHEVGLVVFQPNGRSVIVTPSERALCEAYEMREALEGMAARLAATRTDRAAAGEIGRQAHASLEAALRGDAQGFRATDLLLHEGVATAAGNERLARQAANARDLASVLRQVTAPAPGFSVACGHSHVAIADAIAGGDADGAEAAMRAHIRSVLEHVLQGRPQIHEEG